MECQNIALGTYRLRDEQCVEIVKSGLEYGYRHIDTADLYKNHKQVAEGIHASGVPREDVFLVSKIFNNNIKKVAIAETVDKIKKELDTDYIDLILLHNPVKNYEKAWSSLIQNKTHQNIKYIGTSNFELEHLDTLATETGVRPYLNQIELSLWNQPTQHTIEYHKNANIIMQAHSIYTNNHKTDDLELEGFGMNKYRFLNKYISDQGIPIVIGSSNVANVKENYDWVFEPQIRAGIHTSKFHCSYRIY